ncbi:MAG TPA: polymerase, partial [Allocoleopsis sp.]
TGWGLRNFSFLYQEKTNIWLGHPHNLFLMLAGEMGIPATIFFCAIIGFILAKTILLLKQFTGEERLILFSYLVAFTGLILFNLADVSMFDFRSNVLGWILLSGMWGCVKNFNEKILNPS